MYPTPRDTSDLDSNDQVTLRDGRKVFIVLDEDSMDVAEVFDVDGQPIGAFNFRYVEGPEDGDYCHHLTWQYLDAQPGYSRCGIGELILRKAIEGWGTTIIANDDDGLRDSTGGHLVGDGPAFVARMREKGLIAKSTYDLDEQDEWPED